MISIIDGEISSGPDKIDFSSTTKEILGWIERNNIKKINPIKEDVFFYELNDVNYYNMKARCILNVEMDGLETIALRRVRWIKESEQLADFGLVELKREFALLANLVETQIQRKPDHNSARQYIWNQELYKIEVSFDPLSAEVAIFLFKK